MRNLYKLPKRVSNGYGGHSGRATPVLIPNTEVKPSSDSGCTAIGGNPETLPAHFYRPGGVDRTIIRDCHSRDSGSNPGPGVFCGVRHPITFYSFLFSDFE
jgi:hypothetical protein